MEIDNDIQCIQRKLSKIDIHKDTIQARKLIKMIITASSSGVDTTRVFPSIAKLLASNDMLVKKLAYWYVSENSGNSDLILLVINTLLKDCEDPNPMIRGMAIKALTNLPGNAVMDYCIPPVTACLVDPNAYVRRAAVIATIRVHRCHPALVIESGWVDTMYKMIRDNDPIVVGNCLHGLSVILQGEGGIVVNRNIAHHLLNRISQFPDYHVIGVIKTVKKYIPRTEDEVLEIMNIMDPYLKSDNACVVIETMEYFLFLIRNMPHLKSELYKRASQQIHQLLGSNNPELVFVLLEYVQRLLSDGLDFCDQFKVFFCKYNEPTYLKAKKISMLPHLTDKVNVQEILEELKMYSLDTSVTKSAVHAMCSIAHSHPQYCGVAVNSMLLLLELHPEHVGDDVLRVLQTLDLNQLENRSDALETIRKASLVVETECGKCAFVSLLGQYGELMETAPYILEDYIQQALHNGTSNLCMSLLTAGVKLLLKRPAECQYMFSMLLEHCLLHNDVSLRDSALFYYHLLDSSPAETMKIVNVRT